MRLQVTGPALHDVGDLVRTVAARVAAVALPDRSPELGDVLAADAVRALVAVTRESLAALAGDLRGTAVLVDVAATDYARTEAHLAGRHGTPR